MKCFFCDKEACAKVGGSKGNIFKALIGVKCWHKREVYVCREHFEKQWEIYEKALT